MENDNDSNYDEPKVEKKEETNNESSYTIYLIGAFIIIFILILLYLSKSKSTKPKSENKKDNTIDHLQQTNTLSDKISDFLSKQQRYLHSLSLA